MGRRQPRGRGRPGANPGGEPLVTANAEALRRLSGIADAFLLHDRDIVQRCDDSVLRAVVGAPSRGFQFIRRARGYTPVSSTHLRAHETVLELVCRLLLEQHTHTKTKPTGLNTYRHPIHTSM